MKTIEEILDSIAQDIQDKVSEITFQKVCSTINILKNRCIDCLVLQETDLTKYKNSFATFSPDAEKNDQNLSKKL